MTSGPAVVIGVLLGSVVPTAVVAMVSAWQLYSQGTLKFLIQIVTVLLVSQVGWLSALFYCTTTTLSASACQVFATTSTCTYIVLKYLVYTFLIGKSDLGDKSTDTFRNRIRRVTLASTLALLVAGAVVTQGALTDTQACSVSVHWLMAMAWMSADMSLSTSYLYMFTVTVLQHIFSTRRFARKVVAIQPRSQQAVSSAPDHDQEAAGPTPDPSTLTGSTTVHDDRYRRQRDLVRTAKINLVSCSVATTTSVAVLVSVSASSEGVSGSTESGVRVPMLYALDVFVNTAALLYATNKWRVCLTGALRYLHDDSTANTRSKS